LKIGAKRPVDATKSEKRARAQYHSPRLACIIAHPQPRSQPTPIAPDPAQCGVALLPSFDVGYFFKKYIPKKQLYHNPGFCSLGLNGPGL
jgi:hypothetical protein